MKAEVNSIYARDVPKKLGEIQLGGDGRISSRGDPVINKFVQGYYLLGQYVDPDKQPEIWLANLYRRFANSSTISVSKATDAEPWMMLQQDDGKLKRAGVE